MRVTKLIEDYVREQVGLAYNGRIKKANDDYRENYLLPAQEIIDRCVESFNEKLKEELSSKGIIITDHISPKKPLKDLVKFQPYFYGINGLLGNEEADKLRKERDDKIKEILITLELGGTKAQLDEMLKNL